MALMKTSLYLLFFSISIIACSELISLDTPVAARQLVIDGSINNLNNGNWLRLSTSTPGLEAIGSNTLGQNATVRLVHDGQSFVYEEVEPGKYFLAPETFQGQVGEIYHLSIVTADNQTYESEEVMIPEPIEITSSRAALVELVVESNNGTVTTEYYHDVFLEFVNSTKDQFVKIDNKGMAEVFVDYLLTECASPLTLPRGPAAGLNCWSFRDPISLEIQLTSNKGIDRTANHEAKGVRVPFQYRARYVTTLTANNMSVNSFNYWEKVQQQLNSVGGPFDPPIEPLPRNIRNVNDATEIVLGYFHAYGSSIENTCFDRLDVPENSEIPIFGFPCLITCEEHWAPATFEDPLGLDQCSN